MFVKDDTGQGRNKNKWRKDKTGGNSTGNPNQASDSI